MVCGQACGSREVKVLCRDSIWSWSLARLGYGSDGILRLFSGWVSREKSTDTLATLREAILNYIVNTLFENAKISRKTRKTLYLQGHAG
jgi:hypothetical protein